MSPLVTLPAADGSMKVKRSEETRGASGMEGLLVQFMVMRLLLRVSVTRDGGRSNSMGLILDARNVHPIFRIRSSRCICLHAWSNRPDSLQPQVLMMRYTK